MRHQVIQRLCAIAALATLVAGNAGCGHKKISECNALVQVMNSTITGLEKAPKVENDPSGRADLRAMADSLDKVATDVGAIPLTLPEVKKMATDYQKLAKEIAKAERELAAASESKDPTRRSTAEAALDAAAAQEGPLVENINKFCQKP